MKLIRIETSDNRAFTVEGNEVADNRAKYYCNIDSATSYKEEFEATIKSYSDLTDWLFSNMDWQDCRTLREVGVDPTPIWELEVEKYYILNKKDDL